MGTMMGSRRATRTLALICVLALASPARWASAATVAEIALNLLRQRHHASRRRDQPERSFLQGHVSAHRGIAQAILRRVPGAHREEEPELDVVSIQPG